MGIPRTQPSILEFWAEPQPQKENPIRKILEKSLGRFTGFRVCCCWAAQRLLQSFLFPQLAEPALHSVGFAQHLLLKQELQEFLV